MQGRWLVSSLALIALTFVSQQVPIAHGETLDCLIKPYVMVHVSSAVEGILDTVTVDRGDLVQEGQVLAKLKSAAEQAAVALYRARAAMQAPIKINQTRLELSARQHARNKTLHKDDLITANEMDETKTAKRLAELELSKSRENQRMAKFELQRAMAELSRRTITSPIAGTVVERLRHPGEFADDKPILTLAQLHPLRIEVFVPIAHINDVAVGMRAEVTPESPVGGVYEANATAVDRVADAASGTFGVRLELPNPSYDLPAGLKCKLRFLPK
jgi:RND family efflux transporter MFP subunit